MAATIKPLDIDQNQPCFEPGQFHSYFSLNDAIPPNVAFVKDTAQIISAKDVSIWLEPWRIEGVSFGVKFHILAAWQSGEEIHEESTISFDDAREKLFARALELFKEPDIMEETPTAGRSKATKIIMEIISYLIANGIVTVWVYLLCALFSWSFNPMKFIWATHWLITFTNGIFALYSGTILYNDIKKIRRL